MLHAALLMALSRRTEVAIEYVVAAEDHKGLLFLAGPPGEDALDSGGEIAERAEVVTFSTIIRNDDGQLLGYQKQSVSIPESLPAVLIFGKQHLL